MSGRANQVTKSAESVANEMTRSMERREALGRFGMYAAVTAPAMTVLLASRQSRAAKFPGKGATGGVFPGGGPTGGVFPGKGGGKGGGYSL
jgi:hypothetical protein